MFQRVCFQRKRKQPIPLKLIQVTFSAIQSMKNAFD